MTRAVLVAALFILLGALASCGTPSSSGKDNSGDGGQDEPGQQEPVHSVPEWIKGRWQVVRINFGNNVESQGMYFIVHGGSFEYHYPGCDVTGVLSMDASLPAHAVNEYIMVMNTSDCSVQWDIPTYPGAQDAGYIWSEDGGQIFYRASFNYDMIWVYSFRSR